MQRDVIATTARRTARPSLRTTALVVVHLSSLDAYAWHADEYGVQGLATRLGRALAAAVREHEGPVVVVDQQWRMRSDYSIARAEVIEAIGTRTDVTGIRFDEDTGSWRTFLPRLRASLVAVSATRVRLGGLWNDNVKRSGCVNRVDRYLRRYYPVTLDTGIAGAMDDFLVEEARAHEERIEKARSKADRSRTRARTRRVETQPG